MEGKTEINGRRGGGVVKMTKVIIIELTDPN